MQVSNPTLPFKTNKNMDKNRFKKIASIIGKKIRKAIRNRDIIELQWLQDARRSFLDTYNYCK